MELRFIFLSIITVITSSDTLCRVGCPCLNDNSCEYYCNDYICQDRRDYDSTCMGHNIHPRECGSSFCDPSSNYTCQDKSTGSSSGPPLYILLPAIAGGIAALSGVIIIIFVIIYIKKQQRNIAPNPVWSSNYSNYSTQYNY